MAKRKHAVSSRDRGHRLLRWLLLVTAGLGSGWLLGEMAAENLNSVRAGADTSYSGLSANPDASAPVTLPQDACLDCPDSYGVAVRMRAVREQRMDDAFRELGAVDADGMPADEPAGEYHYGGRFADSDAPASETAMATDTLAYDAANPALRDTPPP